MGMIPRVPVLGELLLLQVLESFDGPRLFTCANLSGQRFLAVWVDESVIDESVIDEIWLYVPVSQARLNLILNGEFDLAIAFAQPEDRLAYVVTSPYDQSRAS